MTDETKNDGGPAFPTDIYPQGQTQSGMTLRDWFAGQAMAGILSTEIGGEADKDDVVEQAYFYADAMLRARSK